MPEDITGSPEQQIAALERQIQEKRAELGKDQNTPYERQEVRDIIVEHTPPAADAESSTPAAQPVTPVDVQPLVQIALTRGVQEAIAEAQKTNNPAVVDALHDALVDEYYPQLIDRRKVAPAP